MELIAIKKLFGKTGITKIQAIAIIAIIVIAAIGGVFYYQSGLMPAPTAEQVLVIGTTDRPTTLDPGSLLTSAAAWTDQFVLDTLFTFANGSELIPWLAESYTISEDGKEIDLYLEEGVMWHDGSEFTAEDVKFSIDRESYLPGVMNYLITMNIESCEVIDTYHVKIKTIEAMPMIMLKILSSSLYAPVPKDNIQETAENATAWGCDAWGYDVFVGTGPYKLVEYVIDEKIVLEKNDNYWAKTKGYDPTIDTIIIKYYGDPAALRMALETKEIDITFRGLDPLDIPDLIANPDIEVSEIPFTFEYLDMHLNHAPLNNTKVRKAIAYAVNVTNVLEKGFKNRGVITYSCMPPPAEFWYNTLFAQYHYDPDMAVELLTEAGYPDGFNIELYLHSELIDPCTVIAADLAEVGIDVKLVLVDRVEIRNLRRNGFIPMEVGGWFPDYPDPHNWMTEIFFYHQSYSYWHSERFEELEILEKSASDDNTRKTYFSEMSQIVAEEVPLYPLAFVHKSVAYQEYVKNFVYPTNFYCEVFGYGYCTIEKD